MAAAAFVGGMVGRALLAASPTGEAAAGAAGVREQLFCDARRATYDAPVDDVS